MYLFIAGSVNKIIDFHYNFEKIHPFQDGNGRVGRLIMFKECLKNNIVPFILEDEKKQFYYMGLKEYPNSKTRLIETCLYSQDIYKDVLKYFKIDYDDKIINNNANKEVKNKDKLLQNIKSPAGQQDNLQYIKYHAVSCELKDLIDDITKITELEKYNSKITKLTYKNKNGTDIYVLQRKKGSIIDLWYFNEDNDFNKIQALKFIKDWDEKKR